MDIEYLLEAPDHTMTVVDESLFRLSNPEIYVVTTAYEERLAGQVATWVTLASLIPECPRVQVVLSPCTDTCQQIECRRAFVLNLLAEHQSDWIQRFGMQSGRQVSDKFTSIPLTYIQDLPILPETCGWALCQVSHRVDLGDRILWVADVIQQVTTSHTKPLRRQTGLAALSAETIATLKHQRLDDIERDRALRPPMVQGLVYPSEADDLTR